MCLLVSSERRNLFSSTANQSSWSPNIWSSPSCRYSFGEEFGTIPSWGATGRQQLWYHTYRYFPLIDCLPMQDTISICSLVSFGVMYSSGVKSLHGSEQIWAILNHLLPDVRMIVDTLTWMGQPRSIQYEKHLFESTNCCAWEFIKQYNISLQLTKWMPLLEPPLLKWKKKQRYDEFLLYFFQTILQLATWYFFDHHCDIFVPYY
jgi:hypothetical protein